MDDVFIKKVCNGDTDAFRYFVSKYKDMAYTIAFSISKNEFAAQEIAQEAFVKAFKNLASFSQKSSFSTWFYRIVVNEGLLRLKKEKKEPVIYTDVIEEIPDEESLASFSKEEKSIMISEALTKLPANESLVLRLYYLQGESIKEVCEITGWSESNTKVMLHRARKNMYTIMLQLMNPQL